MKTSVHYFHWKNLMLPNAEQMFFRQGCTYTVLVLDICADPEKINQYSIWPIIRYLNDTNNYDSYLFRNQT